MRDLDRIQGLVENTLADFDKPGISTAASLRQCLRIARLRNDSVALLWMEMESADLQATAKDALASVHARLLAHMDEQEAQEILIRTVREYLSRRGNKDGKTMIGLSIEQLENQIQHLKDQAAEITVPPGLHPVDLYRRSDELAAAKIQVLQAASGYQDIVDRTRAAMHSFLVDTEVQLDYGRINADVFERTRVYVDERLGVVAPQALRQFQSAYQRVQEGDHEALAQAATSCRRILKTVADALYPATNTPIKGADGVERSMTDDRYINRLLQYISDQGQHASADVVEGVLASFAQRLGALNSLASKGVHAAVTAAEVDLCVVQTYLLTGELLRLSDGSHLWMAAE